MKPQIPWLGVFVEGVVIVGSILLAFGIEAAWEGRQEERQARDLERTGLELMLADLVADIVAARSGAPNMLYLN